MPEERIQTLDETDRNNITIKGNGKENSWTIKVHFTMAVKVMIAKMIMRIILKI